MVKRFSNLVLAAAAASAIFAFAPSANANLVSNGSFENPDGAPTPPYQTLPDGSTAIADWTVGPGTVDWIDGYWPAQDGTKSVDLSGTSQGTISQEITGLIDGTLYYLTFYLATNKDRPPPQPMEWEFGSQSGVASALTSPIVGWVKYYFALSSWVDGDTATLLFRTTSVGDPNCPCFGPAIDSVTVEAVPLPAALPLLLVGLGAVGYLGRRRAKKAPLAA